MKIKLALTILLAVFVCTSAFSQEKSRKKVVVSGRVVNQEGTAVSDVIIFLDGKNSKVTTGPNGEFRLKFRPNIQKIAFYSFTEGGYEMDYTRDTGDTEQTITIDPDFEMITLSVSEEGDYVDTGFGKIYKDEFTGTASSIRSSKYRNNTYTTIFEMIAGEVPGVSVVGSKITIRGPSSFNLSNQPLFVVNGTPVSSINHIAPSDVESIDILKGPSTAMYGSKGTAGVIVIRLKGSGK